MSAAPTLRQLEVLRAIAEHQAEQGHAPTVRELGERLGIRSTNGVMDHIEALERKGLVVRGIVRARSLALTVKARRLLGLPATTEELQAEVARLRARIVELEGRCA